MKKILAIILAMLMVLSLAACGTTDENKNTESDTEATEKPTDNADADANDQSEKATDGNEDKKDEAPKLPSNEAEIFTYVMDSLKAAEKYNGDITATASMKALINMKMGEFKQEQTNTTSAFMTFDGTNKVSYFEEIMEDKEGKYADYGKYFFNGDKLYQAEKSVSPDSSSSDEEIEISNIHDSKKDEYTNAEKLEIFGHISDIFAGFKLAENIAEVKDAFTTATPNLINDLYSGELSDATPTVTHEVSAKTADGIYTLTVSVKSSATEAQEDGTTLTMAANISHELSVKDGKLTDYKSKMEMSQKATQGETVMQDFSQVMDMDMSVEYTFAKEKYDAFEVTLPEDLSTVPVIDGPPTKYEDVYLNIYINGVEANQTGLPEDCTPQTALSHIISNIDSENINIKIFKDEAMTKELTEQNVTKEDILALENVYLSVTPKAGYAVLLVKNSERDEFSKPYKIVMPTLEFFSSKASAWNEPLIVLEPCEYMLDEQYVTDSNCEIWIDGVKQEQKPEKLTLEDGKIYFIEYVEVLSEKQFTAK